MRKREREQKREGVCVCDNESASKPFAMLAFNIDLTTITSESYLV